MSEETQATPEAIECHCGRDFKTVAGLKSHKRSCQGETTEDANSDDENAPARGIPERSEPTVTPTATGRYVVQLEEEGRKAHVVDTETGDVERTYSKFEQGEAYADCAESYSRKLNSR